MLVEWFKSGRGTELAAPHRARRAARLASIVVAVILAACSSDDKAKPANTKDQQAAAMESSLVINPLPGEPRFKAPDDSKAGAPNVNTVPSAVPQPKSTKEERAKTIEGLVADRENARHSDQVARTMPVTVRPLSDAPPAPQPDLTPPPAPQAAKAPIVQRLETPPPSRPEEATANAQQAAAPVDPAAAEQAAADAATAASARAAALPGPRQQSALPQVPVANNSTDSRTATISATSAGYKSLSNFNAGEFHNTEKITNIEVPSGALSPSDRSALSNAALKQAEHKAVIRILAHGRGNVRAGLERATTVARELERLGVPTDHLYVGADAANGSTEVFLHY